MTIRRTEWHPDTCRCGVVFAWDDAVDPVLRTHSLIEILEKDPAHAGLDDVTLYDTLFDENRRKNLTFNIADKQVPGIDLAAITWTFTGSGDTRVLEITFAPGTLNAGQLTAVQNLSDLQFGPNKVVVS